MEFGLGNPINTNCDFLKKLLAQENEITIQINQTDSELNDTYNNLSVFGKIASCFPVLGYSSQMVSLSDRVKSLNEEKTILSREIQTGLGVLRMQLIRTVKEVSGKILKSTSLTEFEKAYDKCNELITLSNTDKEFKSLTNSQIDLVYLLIKCGAFPSDSWIDNHKEDFEYVLSDALQIDFDQGNYGTLLYSIFANGQTSMLQQICDHLSREEFLDLIPKKLVGLRPIGAAIRNGHDAIIEIIAQKYPEAFNLENLKYRDCAIAVRDGNTKCIEILAKTMPLDDFERLITQEGDVDGPLDCHSLLGWAVTYDDTDLLKIFQETCPETVENWY